MPSRALLIVNPAAGQSRPRLQKPSAARDSLQSALAPLLGATLVTGGPGDAREAARTARASGYDAVLVAGGDGTVNEAVAGLLAAPGPPLPLGLVPTGTQNVLAHELGLPLNDLDAIGRVLEAGRRRLIDVGLARTRGEDEARPFVLMAGFGFDAAVVGEVRRPVKALLGPAAYALATLGALSRYRSTRVRLTLDGETTEAEAFLVVVANAASYALHRVKVAPFAALDDGWLDVCVFARAGPERLGRTGLAGQIGFAGQMVAVAARRHLRDPRVRLYRAREILLSSDPPVGGQLDGDGIGETPVAISLLPRALPVFVP